MFLGHASNTVLHSVCFSTVECFLFTVSFFACGCFAWSSAQDVGLLRARLPKHVNHVSLRLPNNLVSSAYGSKALSSSHSCQNPTRSTKFEARSHKPNQKTADCQAGMRKWSALSTRGVAVRKSQSGHPAFVKLDDRQITHLICVRLKHLLYDFLRGCYGPFIYEKPQEGGPKHPQQK